MTKGTSETEALRRYEELGITAEMEAAVIDYLALIAAADTCYKGSGCGSDSDCKNPDRPKCTRTTSGNCICTNK